MSLRRRLLSQSAIIFAVRIGGAGVVFLIQAAMARMWGSAVLGEYLVAIATVNLLAIAMPLGFQTTGAYFAADYAARGQGRSLRRFLMHAYGHIVFPGILLLVIAGWLAPLWGPVGERLAAVWVPISLLAVGTAIIYVNGAVLVGLKRPKAGFFADIIFRPLIIVATFGIALAVADDGDGLVPMLWWMGFSYLAVALGHFAFAAKTAAAIPADEAPDEQARRRWWRYAVPWVIVSLSSDFFFDIDLLLLSSMLGHEQIAIFGVCARVFVLSSFGVSAVYAISVPGLMEDSARDDPHGLAHKIGEANLAATGISVVLLGGVAVFGFLVLKLFGDEFLAGVGPLIILCAALVARSVFGPAPWILSARNHPYASVPAILGGLAVLVVGNLVFVPALGLTGAAISAFIALMAGAAGLWLTALKLTGIDVSILPVLTHFTRRAAE